MTFSRSPANASEMDKLRQDLIDYIEPRVQRSITALSKHHYIQIRGALEQAHPSYSEDDLYERSFFLEAFEDRLTQPIHWGTLPLGDLYTILSLLKAPLLDQSTRVSDEFDVCRMEVQSLRFKSRSCSPTSLRRLQRVLQRLVGKHHLVSSLSSEIKATLENEDFDKILSRSLLETCIEIFDSLEDRTSDEVSLPMEGPDASNSHPHDPLAELVPVASNSQLPESPLGLPAPETPERLALQSSRLDEQLSRRLFTTYISSEFPFAPISDVSNLHLHYLDYCQGASSLSASHTLINLCFALVCLGPAAPGCPTAEHFYGCARSQLSLLEERGDTLYLVQCHILQVQYLTAIGNLNLAWQVTGLTIRKAQSLGIHTKDGISDADDDVSRAEVSKRVWHTIQNIERALAMRLGREPQNFHDSCDWDITSPLICELTSANAIPLGMTEVHETYTPDATFFNANTYLYYISKGLGEVEGELRPSGTECLLKKITEPDTVDITDFIKDVEARLIAWKRTYTALVHEEGVMHSDSFTHYHSIYITTVRYLHLTLRYYRPWFILSIALSLPCAHCPNPEPHMRGFENGRLDSPAFLGLVREGARKCFNAATSLSKVTSMYLNDPPQDQARVASRPCLEGEHLEALYACGLTFIAARMIPNTLCISADRNPTKLVEYIDSQLEDTQADIETLINTSHLPDQFKARATLCAKALEHFSINADEMRKPSYYPECFAVPWSAWHRLYRRLELKSSFSDRSNSPISPRDSEPPFASRGFFAWMDSLPVDLHP